MEQGDSEDLARLYPQRNRRRRKRFLTLRNAQWFGLALLVAFVLISVAAEFRYRRGSPGEYGRLYSRRTRRVDIEPRKPYTVVTERSVTDQTGANPMLLEAARRQQYLGVTEADLARMRAAMQPPPADPSMVVLPGGTQPVLGQTPRPDREKARFEITGGPEGVQIRTDSTP